MRDYYNENEPFCAEWLRNLIAAGEIPDGDVDTRDIRDVRPDDLRGYRHLHFFAGIGGWPLAMRQAGWPDSLPLWTGSCPCQPFSAAGGRKGFADERHLWPAWLHLIRECRPSDVVGEQVADAGGLPWLDLVSTDLQGEGYAFGAEDTCSASVGAPNRRQRLYWAAERLAHAEHRRCEGGRADDECREVDGAVVPSGETGGMACPDRRERDRRPTPARGDDCERPNARRAEGDGGSAAHRVIGSVADAAKARRCDAENGSSDCVDAGERFWRIQSERSRSDVRPGPVNGFWRNADWIFCRDGRWRPVEPGLEPLASGVSARVGLLRGFGNAINAETGTVFLEDLLAHKGFILDADRGLRSLDRAALTAAII